MKGREEVDPKESKIGSVTSHCVCTVQHVHPLPPTPLLSTPPHPRPKRDMVYCYRTAEGVEKSLRPKEPTAVLQTGFSFLLTNAGSVVLGKPRRAFAREATDGVNTQELTVMLLGCTLIEICKKRQDGIYGCPTRWDGKHLF